MYLKIHIQWATAMTQMEHITDKSAFDIWVNLTEKLKGKKACAHLLSNLFSPIYTSMVCIHSLSNRCSCLTVLFSHLEFIFFVPVSLCFDSFHVGSVFLRVWQIL